MNYLEKYGYTPDAAKINADIEKISKNISTLTTREVLLTCFSCMDLTSLHDEDTPASISRFVANVTAFRKAYPDYPLPASLCIYPNFVSQVVSERPCPEVHATVTSGCFPTAQSYIEVKCLECRMAVEDGADEVDVVLPLNSFAAGDYDTAFAEIKAMRSAIDSAAQGRKVIFKVILETGLLSGPEAIAQASFLAMEAGADFIKTSTGKVAVNATPMAAFVMCNCIAAYYKATGRMVGFKPAGGMSTAADAVCYYTIVKSVLGQKWCNRQYFRLGVSRMGNNLLSAIEGKEVKMF